MARDSRVSNWSKLAAAGASALVVAGALAAHFEGQRLHAYRDVGGVPTICNGDTHDVHMGQVATPAECAERLRRQMGIALAGVRSCVHLPMTAGQMSAFSDIAYNIGVSRFCRSSIARKFNAGDTAGACRALLLYDKADGKVLRGLRLRRQEEYKLCIASLPASAHS